MGAGIRKNAYDLDKLQQYGRRENMRIAGIAEEEGENLREKVKEIGMKVGVEIRDQDINVVHRSGQRGARPRIVLVRFVSRDVKHELLKKRKNFKDIEALKNVYIGDDLTPLRAKLLKKVKSLGNVRTAHTQNGIIHCNMINGSHLVVETPDDLFHLGLDEIDLDEFGLNHLEF